MRQRLRHCAEAFAVESGIGFFLRCATKALRDNEPTSSPLALCSAKNTGFADRPLEPLGHPGLCLVTGGGFEPPTLRL